MPATTCPTCGGQMQVDDDDLGYELECPHCAARFTPPRLKSKSIRRDAVVDRAFNDDDDDDDDRPRRSRRGSRRRSAYDPPTARERAETIDRARSAGGWLLIVGYGASVLHLLIGTILVIIGVVMMQEPKKPFQQKTEGEVPLIFGIIVLVTGILPLLPVIVGGHKLRRMDTMQNPFWVYAAAITGVGLMVFCTGWPVFWAVGGIGIWAMIVISGTEAQRLLKSNRIAAEDRNAQDEL